MVPWLLVAVQQHPVRATAATVCTSLLVLSALWTGGSGGERAIALDASLRGGRAAEAPGSAPPASAEEDDAEEDNGRSAFIGDIEARFDEDIEDETQQEDVSMQEATLDMERLVNESGGNFSVGVCIDMERTGPSDAPGRAYSNEMCVEKAREAHCRKSPSFMLVYCSPECRECTAHPRCCLGVHAEPAECDESLGAATWGLANAELEERWALFPGVRTIMEVGGNTGYDLVMFAARFPEARIFSFEPVPEYHEALQMRAAELPRATALRFGLADRNFTANFTIDGHSSSDMSLKGKRQVEAIMRDVDEVLRELEHETGAPPDVVSLNCEGCEYAVLRRMAERGWIGRVRMIQLSWHLVQDMQNRTAQRCEVERLLRQLYVPAYFTEHFGWQGWRLHGVPGHNTTRTTTTAASAEDASGALGDV